MNSWRGALSNFASRTSEPRAPVMTPNFVLLDATLPEVATLVAAMVQARDAVETRSWSHPQEPTTEEWWADVLADPRARIPKRRSDYTAKQAFYRLADELRDTILVACIKCDWKAAFRRDELIAAHGAACPMPSLLEHRAAPSSARNGTAAACTTSSLSEDLLVRSFGPISPLRATVRAPARPQMKPVSLLPERTNPQTGRRAHVQQHLPPSAAGHR
jgi:hypothetical protein